MTIRIECQATEGSPSPQIHTLHSYEFPYAFGMDGFIRFYGSYRIQEKRESTGTELDVYESKVYLPQIVRMTVRSDGTESYTVYITEIYKRILHTDVFDEQGMNQTIFFRILSEYEF
jgi:hypothetical protein